MYIKKKKKMKHDINTTRKSYGNILMQTSNCIDDCLQIKSATEKYR